jgi:hypothetical protein
VVLSASTWPVTRKSIQQGNLPQIQNITESFQTVGLERMDGFYVLRMKNTSNQAITHYTLVCPGGLVEGDFIIGDKAIAPGEIKTIQIHESWVDTPDSSKSGVKTIKVALVFFEDHSSEGDLASDRKVREYRLGIRTQLGLINKRLRETNKPSEQISLSSLNESISQTQDSSVSINQDDKKSDAFKSGVHFANEVVKTLIKDLDNWEKNGRKPYLRMELYGTKDVKDGLSKIIAFNEKLASKY